MDAERKPTYGQKWHEYNLAQVNEKAKFQELLFDLCHTIDEPPQVMGRPRAPLVDLIFAVCLKVYGGQSGRRNQTDMREALQRDYLSRPVHYNTISKHLEREELTPYLRELITLSSLPLKAVEDDFAVDSSGFATASGKQSWREAKWGWLRDEFGTKTKLKGCNSRDWIKVHLMCGCKTNVVTSVEVTEAYGADSPQFAPLIEHTSKHFIMNAVCADKAYLSKKNLQLVLVKKAMPYIPFKSTSRVNAQSNSVWRQMYHFYEYNREAFNAQYHKRSNVESTFFMIKSKFGERIRSKTHVARVNEVLAKVLCHNVCVVIQSIYELGVEPTFGADS